MLISNPINIANIIAGLIAIVVGTLIVFKNKKEILNQYFFISLFAWGISFIFNALTFVYTDPETIGVQILRDFATGAGSVAAFFLFITALILLKGPHFLSKLYILLPIYFVMVVNTAVGCIFDHVVFDDELGIGVKTTQEPWVKIFIYIIPVLMISIAIGIFIKIRAESTDAVVRRRISFFILGFAFIVIGTFVFATSGIIEQLIGTLNTTIEYLIWVLAEIFWASSPILLLIGFHVKTTVVQEGLPASE